MSYWNNEYTKHVILCRGKVSRRGVVQEQETKVTLDSIKLFSSLILNM